MKFSTVAIIAAVAVVASAHSTQKNEYKITCAEKRERNPDALTGPIHKNKECCQWSGECGDLKKCTQSYCEMDSKASDVYPNRYDFQF
ncbi:hypothetical protein SARC_12928 [Sphaeroforma arctica JP610]|uniref:Uncharacterized protein n=1 Tax=Sphaeroforma arctica JP610 TaxID=667725 RepID=A0A0L0FCN9_9EUKA|nr:hypothetical protein SARC_12928 [Sphaeroforma arctica JP610]KNC74530.1 hypothetical protein SARC_12928 [Sphaeroforma arctica JP610]|eukprot:XP_014148432.1 hypothetical protein SARC_12928 [Sphaeroforma arctica JP610]